MFPSSPEPNVSTTLREDIVFLELGTVLRLGCHRCELPEQVWVGNQEYRSITTTALNGFYDWLRDANSKTIGIRISPDEQEETVLKHCGKLSYAHVRDSHSVELYVGENRLFVEELSDDQDFGGNRIYANASGGILITVLNEYSGLSPEGWEALFRPKGRWIDVRFCDEWSWWHK